MAQFLFWLSLAVALLTYLGYPVLLAVWSHLRRRPVSTLGWLPSVSVVMAVHNGERWICGKLANLLAVDYPQDRLEFIVVSDGSTDRTFELAQQINEPHMHIIKLPAHGGKPTALNRAVEQASGEIVVFTDVRQKIAADAVRKIVTKLGDPSVGAVSGELILTNKALEPQLGLYYRCEQWIRLKESEIHSMVGVTGALSAIRRSLYRPLPSGLILDDVYTPMQIVLRGYRVVLEPTARAYDPHDERPEFQRKLRTLAGNYELPFLLPEILTLQNPVLLQYVCHKLARLVVPFFLLLLLGTSLWLHRGVYAAILAAQLAFYASALCFRGLERFPLLRTVSASSFSFVLANCAAVAGLFAFVRGKKDIWV